MEARTSTIGRSASLAILAVGVVFAAAALGSAATAPAIKGWYAEIAKPWFTPPNWVFGPAWTTLYALMAYAFWRVLALPANLPGRRDAILAFLAQLALNALWSFAFFAWRSPGAGLAVVLVLWLAIAVTIARFRALDRVAALCLAPYLAWTTFAAALNAGVYALN
jgi:translocator protein